MTTLTDYEQFSNRLPFDLANGHAYQEFSSNFRDMLNGLQNIWTTACGTAPGDLERTLRLSFATLIGSAGLKLLDQSMISPTASNSIDIVAAYMASENIETLLLEPTFDNLALLFRRRGCKIRPLPEDMLTDAIVDNTLDAVFACSPSAGALFVVNPNNPTGQTLDEASFRSLCEACARNDITLIVDNSFRMFNRHMFDDYAVMIESGVSFVAFEDTGKCWPTLDLKLSMMFSSVRHLDKLQELYRELYLGPSRFAVALFAQMFERTHRAGIENVVWDLIDKRRARLREVLRGSGLVPVTARSWSPMPIEWIRVEEPGKVDLDVCRELAREGLGVLPGRQFFWSSASTAPVDMFVRISLLKPAAEFAGGLSVLQQRVSACRAGLAIV